MPHTTGEIKVLEFEKGRGRKKIIRTVIGTVAVLILGIVAISFTARQIVLASKTLQEKRSLLYVWEKRDETLTSLKEDFKKIEEDLPQVKKALPKEEEIIDFIAALENVALSAGIEQTIHFEPKTKDKAGAYPIIVCKVDLGGNLDSTIRYLSEVEGLVYFVKFNNLDMIGEENIQKSSEAKLLSEIYIKE